MRSLIVVPVVRSCSPILAVIGIALTSTVPASAQQLAGWAGSIRCELQAQAQGYSHQETQTWTLTGAPTVQGSVTAYPATWTVVGTGQHDRTTGTSTRRIAQWTANVTGVTAPIGFTLHALGRTFDVSKWHAQLTRGGGYTGTDQFINGGVPASSQPLAMTVYEWQFPKIEAAITETKLEGSNTTQVRAFLGPLQPGEAVATVTCTWSLARGSAPSPLPPSTMPPAAPPAIPPAGSASGGTTPAGTAPPATTAGTTTPSSTTPGVTAPGGTVPPGSTVPPGGTAPPPPVGARIVGVSPNSLPQGIYAVPVTLTGEGTNWQPGTTVDFGPGITMPFGVNVRTPTTLDVTLYGLYGIAGGPRQVTVTTGGQAVTLANALTITPRDRPSIVSISPNSALVGQQTVQVTFTGNGTRFAPDTRVIVLRPEITVASWTVHSPTSATAVINVAPDAPLGAWDISIQGAGNFQTDDFTVPNAFTVRSVAPSVTVVTPSENTRWPAGSPLTNTWEVRWGHNYPAGQAFDIAFSLDGGTTWLPPIGTTTASNLFVQLSAHQELTPTAAAVVRVNPSGNPAAGAMSKAFSIRAPSASATPETASLTSRIANVRAIPPNVVAIDEFFGSAYFDSWWQVRAVDDPAAAQGTLQFRASVSGGPPSRTYDLEISEPTASGRVARSHSGTSATPQASIQWSNAPNADDSRTFFVRIRHSVDAQPGERYRLTLTFGGPLPSALETATVVPIIPAVPVVGVSGTTPAPAEPVGTPVPLAPPVETVATSGRYRVSIVGLAVGKDTGDGGNDGAGDEIYIATHARIADRRMFTSAWQDTPNSIGQPAPTLARSATFGDTNRFPSRTKLGTASATGGLRTDNIVTLPQPLFAWEGTLRDAIDVVFVKPSVWEDDGQNTEFNQWVSHNNNFVGATAQAVAAAASGTSTLQVQQRPDQSPSVTGGSTWPGDRAVGLGRAGVPVNCTALQFCLPPSYRDRILILSRESIEAYLTSSPSGTFLVTFTDFGLPGFPSYTSEYVLTLKIERVP